MSIFEKNIMEDKNIEEMVQSVGFESMSEFVRMSEMCFGMGFKKKQSREEKLDYLLGNDG